MFDECHKAKNLVPTGSAKPTKTGITVLELQKQLPKARVVYCSATGGFPVFVSSYRVLALCAGGLVTIVILMVCLIDLYKMGTKISGNACGYTV